MIGLRAVFKRAAFAMVASLVFWPSLVAAEPGVTDKTVVFGAVIPLSGPPSLIGKAYALGLRVWQADLKDRGGVNGRNVDVKLEDDGYVPARSVQAVKKLVEVDDVFALIATSGSAHLLAMMPLIEQSNIPAINVVAVNTAHFTPPRKSVFVVGPTYCQELQAGIRFLVEKQNLKDGKYGLLYQDDDYGADVRCGYQAAVKDFGLNSVVEIAFKRGQTDFSAEMLKVKAAGVTVLVSGGIITEHAAMLKEASKNRTQLTFIAPHTGHVGAVQKLAGPAGDGYLVADYVPPLTQEDVPGVKRFMDLARKHLSPEEVGVLNRYSLVAYAGGLLMEETMRQCGKELTRACVVAKLENIKNFDTGGIMAPISFTPSTRHFPSSILVVRSNAAAGKFEKVSDFIPVQ